MKLTQRTQTRRTVPESGVPRQVWTAAILREALLGSRPSGGGRRWAAPSNTTSPSPPKMHWPKVFWGFTGTEQDYVPKPQTIGKSSRVRPPWFFENPQLALCLPQCPGLAPQHHDLLPRPC